MPPGFPSPPYSAPHSLCPTSWHCPLLCVVCFYCFCTAPSSHIGRCKVISLREKRKRTVMQTKSDDKSPLGPVGAFMSSRGERIIQFGVIRDKNRMETGCFCDFVFAQSLPIIKLFFWETPLPAVIDSHSLTLPCPP